MANKKLLVINYEYPPLGGGASAACYQTLQELKKLGYDITVLTTTFEGLAQKEESEGIRVIRLSSGRSKQGQGFVLEMFSFILHALFFVNSHCAQEEYDHCLIYFASPFGIIGEFLRLRFGIPYSVSVRGGDIKGFVPELDLIHTLLAPLTRLILDRASWVLCNGECLKQLTQNFAGENNARKIVSVPNGLASYEPHANVREGLALIFVGRLVQSQKNFILALRALKQVEDLDVSLHIVGQGPDENYLRQQVSALGLEAKVKISNWQSKEELKASYQAADVLLLPSFFEGVSNVLLEGIANGLYVLASDIPDNRYFVEKIGVGQIVSNDAFVYAQALRSIYKDRSKLNLHLDPALVSELSWANMAKLVAQYLNTESTINL